MRLTCRSAARCKISVPHAHNSDAGCTPWERLRDVCLPYNLFMPSRAGVQGHVSDSHTGAATEPSMPSQVGMDDTIHVDWAYATTTTDSHCLADGAGEGLCPSGRSICQVEAHLPHAALRPGGARQGCLSVRGACGQGLCTGAIFGGSAITQLKSPEAACRLVAGMGFLKHVAGWAAIQVVC